MVSRKFSSALFLSLFLFSGLAAADESDGFKGREQGLAATNLDLTLSASSSIGFQSGLTRGTPFSALPLSLQPGTWTLPVLADGMEGYVLTAVVTRSGGSGFTGVSLQSTTATEKGYFGVPLVLASNSEPTSYVAEPSAASFLITGVVFAGGMLSRRRNRATIALRATSDERVPRSAIGWGERIRLPAMRRGACRCHPECRLS